MIRCLCSAHRGLLLSFAIHGGQLGSNFAELLGPDLPQSRPRSLRKSLRRLAGVTSKLNRIFHASFVLPKCSSKDGTGSIWTHFHSLRLPLLVGKESCLHAEMFQVVLFGMRLFCLQLEASCSQLSFFTYSCVLDLFYLPLEFFCLQLRLLYLQLKLLYLQWEGASNKQLNEP